MYVLRLILLMVLSASMTFYRYFNSCNWETRSPNACDDILFIAVDHHGTRRVRKYSTAI